MSGYWYDDEEGPLDLSGTISGRNIDVIVHYPYALTWNLQATVNESVTEFSGKVVVTGVLNGEQPIHCVRRGGEASDNDGDGQIDEPGTPTSSTGTLPDTGQTRSYTDTFGEDSDYLINPPSYTKLDAQGNDLTDSATEWTMVRDNVTGLIWEVKTDDGSIHDKDDTYTWRDSHDYFVAELNSQQFAGYSDWRLPSVKDLTSIVNRGTCWPAINSGYFPNTRSSDYWSSTSHAIDFMRLDYAWYVEFEYGYVEAFGAKFNSNYVRAVRAGHSDANAFDNGYNTVTDRTTGLMWQQETAWSMSWEEAISYCEGLTLAGYTDWRLPNINELQSIVNYSTYDPAIDTTVFSDTDCAGYWSSTTLTSNTIGAWHANFKDGQVGSNSYKLHSYCVRAVRCAQ